MTAITASTKRRVATLTAGAIVALCSIVAGCQNNSAAFMYEQEAHGQEVSAWCYAYNLGPTPSLHQDCVRRAWVGVPPSECFTHPCNEQFNALYAYQASYDSRRIEK
jgi:hypothetical protein